MGIPNLNKLFIEKCNDHINKTHLSKYKGKTIVIDTSIYLYKFAGQEKLVENFYLLVSILKFYNICPIFVFDGKPPDEKKELLKKRKLNKQEAEEKYNTILKDLDNPELSKQDKQEITIELEKLKKQFVRINEEKIQTTKQLLRNYGVQYIDANGEADIVCANMVINNHADACLSDDMDMFLYGCPKVLRYLSILNHTIIEYDTENILKTLNLSKDEFKQIIVLAGTDYNLKQSFSIKKSLYLYREFKKQNDENQFYEWLITKKFIKNNDQLNETYDLIMSQMETNNDFISEPKPYYKNELISFLKNYDFIFI